MNNCKYIAQTHPDDIVKKRDRLTYPEFRKYTYYSRTAERETPVNVLLPTDYSTDKQYPVVYLLHGFFNNEDWFASPEVGLIPMLTNLHADGEAAEAIVVLPYIYCSKDMPRCTALDLVNVLNYDNFINDLTKDLIPFIEMSFSAAVGRESRAITGFSMGGREALYIGFTRPELFGYVGSACPAPGLTPIEGDPLHPGQMQESDMRFDGDPAPGLVLLTAADNDNVVGSAPLLYHDIMTANRTAHLWHTVPDAYHDHTAVTPHLYNFFRCIFRKG